MPISAQKKEALRLTAILSGSTLLLRAVAFPINILYTNILGPALFGSLKIFDLISTYVGYSSLGLPQTLSRQLPLALGRHDLEESRRVQDTVFALNSLTLLVALIFMWLAYAVGFDFDGIVNFYRLVLITLILLSNRIDTYIHSYLKGTGEFTLVTKRTVIVDWASPFLLLGFAWLWKLDGALLAMLFINVLGLSIYLHGHPVRRPRWRIAWKRAWFYISIGFDLFLNRLADTIFWTIDTTIIAFLLTADQVGLYAFALGIFLTSTSLTDVLASMIQREMLARRGRLGDEIDPAFLRPFLGQNMLGYLFINLLSIVLFYLMCLLAVSVFLPKYAAVQPVLPILAWGQMFFIASKIPYACLNVLDQLRLRLFVTLGCILLNVALDVYFLSSGYGIVGAGIASSLSYTVYTAILMTLAMRKVYGSFFNAFSFLARYSLVVGILFAVLQAFRSFHFFHLPLSQNMWTQGGVFLVDVVIKFALIVSGLTAGVALLFRDYGFFGELKIGWTYVRGRLCKT